MEVVINHKGGKKKVTVNERLKVGDIICLPEEGLMQYYALRSINRNKQPIELKVASVNLVYGG